MKSFLLSRDLMFSSQVTGAAKQAGLEAKTVGDVEQIETINTNRYVVILDLTLLGLDVSAVVQRLKGNSNPPHKILAVGPHVHEEKLAAASEAGCDYVLSKGQASRELGSLLAQFAD